MQKAIFQIGMKSFCAYKSLKTLCRGHKLLVILKAKKLLESFMKKNSKKPNQKEFRPEKVIKKKVDKIYVKWKGYDSSFNSWVDKKDIV